MSWSTRSRRYSSPTSPILLQTIQGRMCSCSPVQTFVVVVFSAEFVRTEIKIRQFCLHCVFCLRNKMCQTMRGWGQPQPQMRAPRTRSEPNTSVPWTNIVCQGVQKTESSMKSGHPLFLSELFLGSDKAENLRCAHKKRYLNIFVKLHVYMYMLEGYFFNLMTICFSVGSVSFWAVIPTTQKGVKIPKKILFTKPWSCDVFENERPSDKTNH